MILYKMIDKVNSYMFYILYCMYIEDKEEIIYLCVVFFVVVVFIC